MAGRRAPLLAVLTTTLLVLAGCFEPPVLERITLRFLANGAVVVATKVEIGDPEGSESNPALKRRLADTRRALLDGTDPWSARFAALEPAAERFSWEKRLGDVKSVERAAALAEPEELGRFFADSDIAVEYRIEGARAELRIVPGQPGRATRRQRQQVEKAMAEWTEAVASYLGQAGALYRYLEQHPGRAQACFGALFDHALDEKARARLPAPSPEEARQVEALGDAMEKVWAVLQVGSGESYSLDELSHLVYDPLPAPLTVKLPAAPAEVEGFDPGPDGALSVDGPSFWTALAALEGRWIEPDPLLLYIAHAGRSDQPLDLDAFLARPRRAASPPTATEVRREIEAHLELKPLYRAVWTVNPDAEEGEFRWED